MSANTPVVHKWSKRFPLIVTLLSVVAVFSFLVNAQLPSIPWINSVTNDEISVQSGLEADAARYTSMAAFYAASASNNQRSQEADAARYTAMVEFSNANASSIQRALEADATRYTSMAKYYTILEAARTKHSQDADAARYSAMAKYYFAK